jgi:hypothetical protein
MLRPILLLAAGASIGFVSGFLIAREHASGGEGARPIAASALREGQDTLREDPSALARGLSAQIDDLRRSIEELAVSLQSSPSSERAPIEPATTAPTGRPAELEARFDRLEQALDRIMQATESQRRVILYPSSEQLRAARRDNDRSGIAQVSATFCRDREQGLDLVRYRTFDEILDWFGAPTSINGDGSWFYERPEGQTLGPEAIALDFVNGYVVMLHSTDE